MPKHLRITRPRPSRPAFSRSRHDDDPEYITARQNLKALVLEDHVRRVVSEAPPLSDEQKERIAALLRAGGGGVS